MTNPSFSFPHNDSLFPQEPGRMVKLSPNVVCRPTSPTGRSLQKTEQEFTARILQESTAAIPSPENGKCDPPQK